MGMHILISATPLLRERDFAIDDAALIFWRKHEFELQKWASRQGRVKKLKNHVFWLIFIEDAQLENRSETNSESNSSSRVRKTKKTTNFGKVYGGGRILMILSKMLTACEWEHRLCVGGDREFQYYFL